jgi:hypothetical protein
MPIVSETIPSEIVAEAEAARAWFSNEQGAEFKLTGILDPEVSIASCAAGPRELQLILCGTQDGQEVCLRERFQVEPAGSNGGFDVTHVAENGLAVGSPAPLLDPPAGLRKRWLTDVMQEHAFVVLVFYRGFW